MDRPALSVSLASVLALAVACSAPPKSALVIETDFGQVDGAVSAMKGVALSIDHPSRVRVSAR